jgi:hypothetical protein
MQRRRNVISDSEIKFKVTCDEKDLLQQKCENEGISMSNAIRRSLNCYFNKEIFPETLPYLDSVEYNAISIVQNALRKDKALYTAFHSAIAIKFQAEFIKSGHCSPVVIKQSNDAAKAFLDDWISK